MKEPVEIKDALLKHASAGNYCLGCPYHNDPYEPGIRCADNMCYDAHEYIEILEDYNREIFERMPKWIDVKDKLPEEGLLCCVVSDGDVCVSYWHTGEGGRWFYTNGEYDCNVTHWMLLPPLPDLPREGYNE